MRFFERAYCCRVYGLLVAYDASLAELRSATDDAIDLRSNEHRKALLRWLRQWGCRHLRVEDSEQASEVLAQWAARWLPRLASQSKPLDALDESELNAYARAYGELAGLAAGFSDRRTGRVVVRFGATAAAKALFALRPDTCLPWDKDIRAELGYDGSAESYHAALIRARTELADAAASIGVSIAELPALIGRPESSAPKLIDEHDLVRYTKNHEPPSVEELGRWHMSSPAAEPGADAAGQ